MLKRRVLPIFSFLPNLTNIELVFLRREALTLHSFCKPFPFQVAHPLFWGDLSDSRENNRPSPSAAAIFKGLTKIASSCIIRSRAAFLILTLRKTMMMTVHRRQWRHMHLSHIPFSSEASILSYTGIPRWSSQSQSRWRGGGGEKRSGTL